MCPVCEGAAGEAFVLSPTVIVRFTPEKISVVTVGKGPDEALLVFRGPEDARGYQEAFGKHVRGLGFELVGMTREAVASLLDKHDLSYVAMPEPWTGDARVDLFTAENFLRLLEHAEVSEGRPAE
jgi:hypothetical protein